MKTLIQLIVITILLLSFHTSSDAQTNEAAHDYFTEISKSSKSIKSSTWQYLRTIAKSKNPKRVESQRVKLLATIKKAHDEISAIESTSDNTSLREGILTYLDLQYKVIDEDYAAIVDMEEIAEQSYDAMEAYLLAQEEASKKLDEAGNNYSEIQKEYCKKNNIILLKDDDLMSQKIAKASDALNYYNDLFLLTFKSNMEEGYIIDAVERNDLNALQQSINALSDFSEEGIESLKDIDSYMGDTKLKYAAGQQLKYYKEASEKSYPKMVDLFLAQEEYEKANKNFEKIKPKKRTKKDVDTFNKIVDKYNKASNQFNSVSQSLNQKRDKLFNDWEKAQTAFFKKHVD